MIFLPLIWLRSIIATGLFLVTTIVGCILVFVVAPLPKSYYLQTAIMRLWGQSTLWFFGIRVHVRLKGTEFPKGCLFLFNHASHMDIPILMAKLKSHFRFGAKIELFKIPLWGPAMRIVGALPIARENRAEVFKVYEAARARVKNGESFILAPEGTRQESDQLGPFKAGPFVFAVNSGMPLVPVVIYGARRALKKGDLLINTRQWFVDIYMEVLDVISVEGKTLENVGELQQRARQAMLESFEQLKAVSAKS